MWPNLIRDYPKVREDYSGIELAEYDGVGKLQGMVQGGG